MKESHQYSFSEAMSVLLSLSGVCKITAKDNHIFIATDSLTGREFSDIGRFMRSVGYYNILTDADTDSTLLLTYSRDMVGDIDDMPKWVVENKEP